VGEMNAVGHRFPFFENAATGRGSVVYRRYDGHYGLIEPLRDARADAGRVGPTCGKAPRLDASFPVLYRVSSPDGGTHAR